MVRNSRRSRPQALVDHVTQKSGLIDSALEAALAKIRANPALPATQETVARLAECSRGTVNNRATVLEALHEIKKVRRVAKVIRKTAVPNEPENEVERLREQLENSRDEVGRMLNQRDDIQRKFEMLQKNYALLAEKARLLQAELSEKGVLPHRVVPLRPSPKGR